MHIGVSVSHLAHASGYRVLLCLFYEGMHDLTRLLNIIFKLYTVWGRTLTHIVFSFVLQGGCLDYLLQM